MARTPKATASSDTEIQVRLDIVKTLVVIPQFMELDLPVQLSIMETLVKYVLTGERA